MIPKVLLAFVVSLVITTIGNCANIDVDTMSLIDLQNLAVANASSIKTFKNQIENAKIDLKQQHFWYWATPQVNLQLQVDAEQRRITTTPNVGVNLDQFFWRGRDNRNRVKINISNIQIQMEREVSLVKIDVKNKYENYIVLKQKTETLEKNKKQLEEILKTMDTSSRRSKESTGLALLIQQQNQLTDSIYQTHLDLNQRRSDLISVVEGNR